MKWILSLNPVGVECVVGKLQLRGQLASSLGTVVESTSNWLGVARMMRNLDKALEGRADNDESKV